MAAYPMRRPAAFLLAGALALTLPALPAIAETPLPPDAVLTIPGRGWGHGRGMGQYGAKGMAQGSRTYREILSHYYTGITYGTRANDWLRVLVETSPDVVVTSSASFTIKYSDGEVLATSSTAFPQWRVTYVSGNYRVQKRKDGTEAWVAVATDPRYIVFAGSSDALVLMLANGSRIPYRGTMTARYASGDGMRSINTLRMEDYLRGVVPRESPSSWPAEQLKAQTVAARTYAYRKRDNSRERGTTYDICASTACQVYGGKQEAASTDAAISATAGIVLLYDGAPILAEYSSTTGGYTAPGSVPYQKAVPDPTDSISPYHEWQAQVPVRDIESTWPALGRLVKAEIAERNGFGEWGGRVRTLRLVGTDSTVTVSGDGFRSAFSASKYGGVRSSWFTIGYWAADRVSVPTETSLPSGGQTSLILRYRNRGSEPWPVDGAVTLATDAGSGLRGSSWVDDETPSRITRNASRPAATTVNPGEIAEFRVALDASALSVGQRVLPLRLVTQDATVLDASDLAVEITAPWIDEAPTLLQGSTFEKGFTGWRRTGGVSLAPGRDGSEAVRIRGAGTLRQVVDFAGGTKRRFGFAAWTERIGGGTLSVLARIRYAGGAEQVMRLAVPGGAHPWTYTERPFLTSSYRQLASITIEMTGSLADGGAARLDGLRLIEDPLANGSFEAGLKGWRITEQPEDSPTARPVGWTASDGANSLAIAGRTTPVAIEQRFPLTAPAWERVRLRFTHRAYQATPEGGPWTAELILEHPGGTVTSATVVLPTTDHPWAQEVIELRPRRAVSAAIVRFRATEQTGNMYIDQVRLVRSRHKDPSFEDDSSPWTDYALGSDDLRTPAAARDGLMGMRLTAPGGPSTTQSFTLRGPASRVLRLGAWANALGMGPSGRVFIGVTFFHKDGSRSTQRLSLGTKGFSWRYAERRVASTEAYESVRVAVVLEAQSGWASVDGVTLVDAT